MFLNCDSDKTHKFRDHFVKLLNNSMLNKMDAFV